MRNENLLIDLSSLSLIRVHGADAKSFLDGQFTNDLDLITAERSQLSAWCTAQGRMLAVLRIFLRDGFYYLQLPASLRDDVIKRLRMFVLRSKVVLEIGDELTRLGLVGPDAESILRNAVGIVPDNNDGVATRDGVTVLRLAGIHPRFEIIAPTQPAEAIRARLESAVTVQPPAMWSWHDIMTGIPIVLPQTREMFVPQMANLELVGGVNFKKGCYPGQEIVARMQYLGRLKQRMYRARYDGEPVAPGTDIYTATADQSAGNVIDAQPSPDGGTDMLAVIRVEAVETGELHLGSANGPRFSIEALPYAVDPPSR
jgi:folate-binding protein YgfZ